MNLNFDQTDHPVLPADLSRLDESLAEMASRQPVPSGLSERVYAASVNDLPRQRLRLRGRTATVAPTYRPHWLHRTAWGQLAMAASIMLAFVAGVWFLSHQPVAHDFGGMTAHHDEMQVTTVHVAYQRSELLSAAAERELFESMYNNGDHVAYLYETRDMTYADVHRDLARLLDDLEL